MSWLRQYGGYALIALGGVLFSLIIPSAAGPSDALPRQRLLAPAPPGTTGGAALPLLIGSARTPPGPAAQPAAAPTAVPPAASPVPAWIPEISGVPPAEAPPLDVQTATALLPPSDRIVIPRIALDVPVVDVGVLPNGEMDTAAYAVGRLSLGADAGELGNVVLAGHNDVLGEVFRRLPELQPGDDVVLQRAGTAYRYVVEGKTIVREVGASEAQRRENARWMDHVDDSVVTLISCYPYRVDTHRYIVRARLAGTY